MTKELHNKPIKQYPLHTLLGTISLMHRMIQRKQKIKNL